MNAASDTVLNTSADEAATARQEQQTEPKAELVELGKVSDTRGGWIGVKADNGLGVTYY